MSRVVALACVLAAAGTARADGLYVTESFGVGMARGELAPMLGNPLHVRVGAGWRFAMFAIEPWLLSDLQTDRDGALRGIIGGEPAAGTADLAVYGIDAKLIAPIDHALSAYVRVGPSIAEGTGALRGYNGTGVGAGAGMQISGKVRALGFLWAPLFFLKRGPMITGALYVDGGWDFYRLEMAGADGISARIAHVSVGFAVGQSF